MSYANMTFKEASDIINRFLKDKDELYTRIKSEVCNVDILLSEIIKRIQMAIDGNINNGRMGDGDHLNIKRINVILPFLDLSEKYNGFSDFFNAYALLVKNYCDAYNANNVDKCDVGLNESIDTVCKIIQNKLEWSRLVLLTEMLLNKYETMEKYNPDALKLSRMYLKSLLNEEVDTNE